MNDEARRSNQPTDAELYLALLEAMKVEAEPLREAAEKLCVEPYGNSGMSLPELYRTKRPELKTEDEVARATDLTKELLKLIDDRKGAFPTLLKKHRKPLDDALTMMRRTVALWMEPAEKFELELRNKINAYQRNQREKERQTQAPAPAKVQTEHGSRATFSEKWKHRILEPEKVERQYCSPDPRKIQAKIDMASQVGTNAVEKLQIPGVEIYRDLTTIIQ